MLPRAALRYADDFHFFTAFTLRQFFAIFAATVYDYVIDAVRLC